MESKVLGAEERIARLEQELFQELRAAAIEQLARILTTARAMQLLDVLATLAETARQRGYVRPEMVVGGAFDIRGGRHPVVEAMLADGFVPNDTLAGGDGPRVLIITGPTCPASRPTYDSLV